MKANGATVSQQTLVCLLSLMVTYIPDRGLKIKCMVLVNLSTKWGQFILESGAKGYETVSAMKFGLMDQNTLGSMYLV